MVRRIDDNGLVLSLVKLNGKLELNFVSDSTFSAQYTLYGTDVEDTVNMDHAREAAAGQPVVSLGLEMFVESAEGYLDVRFEGAVGSMLAFRYDGRNDGDSSDDTAILRLEPPPGIAAGAMGNLRTPLSSNRSLHGSQEDRDAPHDTRDAKAQTLQRGTRNAGMQTMATLVTHSVVQSKRKRIVNTGTHDAFALKAPRKMSALMPPNVDLRGTQQYVPPVTNGTQTLPTSAEVAHTFTNAVATVFQTFNEPRDPYRQKRLAEPGADYRAYKHIFIEGYRNGDNKEEEGRLHIDLAHHVLLWESFDDYEGGAKLTLDRLDLPRCKALPFSCIIISTNTTQAKSFTSVWSTHTTLVITPSNYVRTGLTTRFSVWTTKSMRPGSMATSRVVEMRGFNSREMEECRL